MNRNEILAVKQSARVPNVVAFLQRIDARYGIDPELIADRTRQVVEERRMARAVAEAEQTAVMGGMVVEAALEQETQSKSA